MVAEELEDVPVPFVGGVDISSPTNFAVVLIVLAIGAMVWQIAQDIGNQGAQYVEGKFQSLTGVNATGGMDAPGVV